MALEWLSGSIVYNVTKDLYRTVAGKRRRLTNAEIISLRQKWKPLFEEEIFRTHNENLRKDIIIRDMKRYDNYPNVNPATKGISSWFRVGLMGIYHKGILVGLNGAELKNHNDTEWRYTDDRINESCDLYAVLIGKIPFENIENVDWSGDGYYGFPHIYCWFNSKRKEPYEELVYCVEKCNPNSVPFYTEIASYDQVRKLSRKFGLTR